MPLAIWAYWNLSAMFLKTLLTFYLVTRVKSKVYANVKINIINYCFKLFTICDKHIKNNKTMERTKDEISYLSFSSIKFQQRFLKNCFKPSELLIQLKMVYSFTWCVQALITNPSLKAISSLLIISYSFALNN